MNECDVQNLGAYHDGELADADRARVEAHLRTCESCRAELGAIREASRLLREARFDDLTAQELAGLHHAVDEVDDYRVWRIGGTLGLIAASILIIGMAWLNALPSPGTGSGGNTTVASRPQPWERMAVTLRVYPPLPTGNAIQPHDLDAAEFMLDGLALRDE